MTGDDLPDEDHVVRYVRPSLIDDDHIDGGAFILRKDETGISVNWLEIFEGDDQVGPLDEIRRLLRLVPANTGQFAKLNVGDTKKYVSAAAREAGIFLEINVLEAPLAATCDYEPDPSHAEIIDVPNNGNNDAAMLVGDLLAACIILPLYPAKA